VDQDLIPAAATAAFDLEQRVESVAAAVRAHPLTMLAVTAGVALLIRRLTAPRHRPRRPTVPAPRGPQPLGSRPNGRAR